MKLKNIRLSIANIAKDPTQTSLPVNETGTIFETAPETGIRSVIGYSITCSGNKGDEIKIKLPLTTEKKITELKNLLDRDMDVAVEFSGLSLRAYAMKTSDGNVFSGISAKADDFDIISTPENIDF